MWYCRLWSVISYGIDLNDIEINDGIYYNDNLYPIILESSLYDILLNFPLKLEKYTQISISEKACIWRNEWSAATLQDFRFYDMFLLWINLFIIWWALLFIIYVIYKIMKK